MGTSKQLWVKTIAGLFVVGIFLVAMASIDGCKKNDNSVDAGAGDTGISAADETADAADAVSDAVAGNNGGAMDQVNDVFEIAGGASIGSAGEGGLAKAFGDSTSLTYNASDTSWSLYVYRQRGVSWWLRNYWHQFVGSSGKAQAQRSGAVKINHKLLNGGGHFQTLRLIHDLQSISSNWTAALNGDTTVTINGTYNRSGRDSLILGNRKGTTLASSLSLTLKNVTGPRGRRVARSAATSGTIDVVYSVTITVPGKTPVTRTKSFTITLGGGNASFAIDGTNYTADLDTGDH